MSSPLVRLADGTVLQTGPLTGTQVWTIPGRSHRPLELTSENARQLDTGEAGRLCSFCPDRYRETTPEKARLVRAADGSTRIDRRRLGAALFDDVAEFRRFANLFEIVSAASWRVNHGYTPSAAITAWAERYLAQPDGLAQISDLLRFRAQRGGPVAPGVGDQEALLHAMVDLLSGAHDVIVARRHVMDGADLSTQLASAGTLTPDEHADFITFTLDGLSDLYRSQPAARYVAAFQNWLRPAGASIEHLHKQLVAIDSYGPQIQREALRLREDPWTFQNAVIDLARDEQLVVAANDHAVAIAGVGHRYPALEVYSTSRSQLPWELSPEEVRGMSDLIHAMHAATGAQVATNEEWHYRPPELNAPMPWRVVLKWRVHVPAGFEGGTKIYVNTIDPWTVRERVVSELLALRSSGGIAQGLRIGSEVRPKDLVLRYAE